MSFVPVAIYDYQSGDFLGFSIKDDRLDKLQTMNIWTDNQTESLNNQLALLNQETKLRQHWPHPQDPDVQALINDPSFHPIEYEEQEVVDEDRSHLVWTKEPEVDDRGEPTGRMIDGSELDRTASVLNYKKAQVPKRPSDVMLRIKKACEQVASQRAGLL